MAGIRIYVGDRTLSGARIQWAVFRVSDLRSTQGIPVLKHTYTLPTNSNCKTDQNQDYFCLTAARVEHSAPGIFHSPGSYSSTRTIPQSPQVRTGRAGPQENWTPAHLPGEPSCQSGIWEAPKHAMTLSACGDTYTSYSLLVTTLSLDNYLHGVGGRKHCC